MLASKTSKRKRREGDFSLNSGWYPTPPVSYLPNRIFEQKHKFSVTLSVQRKSAKLWFFDRVEPLWLAKDFVAVLQLLSRVQLFAPHGVQRTRLPCPSLSPGVGSDSCPSQWCYLTISSSAIPLLLLSSIFLSIRVFSNESALHIRWLHIRIGASASASVLPMNIQGWFPLGLTDLILQSKGLSRVFSSARIFFAKIHACIFLLAIVCSLWGVQIVGLIKWSQSTYIFIIKW